MSRITEEWRPVVGYEGLYEVSDWGNVRSVDRIYESIHKAAEMVGGTVASISRCCNGKQNIYKGSIWKFVSR